jgi:hypothetical protein
MNTTYSHILCAIAGSLIFLQMFCLTVDLPECLRHTKNHDIYVSPDGSDDNTGKSFDAPLRTIAVAAWHIASDPDNPKTIYLAPGVYSLSQNEQIFPFELPAYVNLVGSGKDDTIIDGDLIETNNDLITSFCIVAGGESTISNMTVRRFSRNVYYFSEFHYSLSGVAFFVNGGNIHFTNIAFSDIYGAIFGLEADSIILDDIYINKTYLEPIYFVNCDRVVMTDVHIKNALSPFRYGSSIVTVTHSSYVAVNNLSITNSLVEEAGKFLAIMGNATGTYLFNQVLIANNELSHLRLEGYDISLINFASPNNDVAVFSLNNWTVANNVGIGRYNTFSGHMLGIWRSNINVTNSIFYNPLLNSEFSFTLPTTGSNSHNFSHSLLYKFSPDDYDIVAQHTLFGLSPQFAGMHDRSLTPDMWDYYHLHQSSPCINAGVLYPEIPLYDMAGNPRIFGNRVDMGVFEYQDDVAITDMTEKKGLHHISNYPNPFNPSTTILYTLTKADYVTVKVYNVRGQVVKTLVTGYQPMGTCTTTWDGIDHAGRTVSSGVYFCRLDTSSGSTAKKILLLK